MLGVGGETLMGAMGSRKWSSKSLIISVALSAIMQKAPRLRKPRNCLSLCHSYPTEQAMSHLTASSPAQGM